MGGVERIVRRWHDESVARPPLSPESARHFETKHGIALPNPLAELWSLSDGTSRMCSDHMRFWPLPKWTVEAWQVDGKPQRVVVFSDFLVSTYVFGFVGGPSEQTPVLRGDSFQSCWVAADASTFLAAYAEDQDSIHREGSR